MERDEFQKIIESQKDDREKDLQLEKDRGDLLKKHAEEIRKQIALNEEKKRQSRSNEVLKGLAAIRGSLLSTDKFTKVVEVEDIHDL